MFFQSGTRQGGYGKGGAYGSPGASERGLPGGACGSQKVFNFGGFLGLQGGAYGSQLEGYFYTQ